MHQSTLKYPNDELQQQEKLTSIFHRLLAAATKAKFPDNRTAKDIILDGFYPHFYSQNCKILFIGRESLGLTGEQYIDLMHHCYTVDKKVNNISLNQYQHHSLLLSIAYGLQNDCCNWKVIPPATEIANKFAVEGGTSFAFMNLSKLSNESGGTATDWPLIDGFIDELKKEPVNYWSEEIDVLNPDIILTMNLESRLKALGAINLIKDGDKISNKLCIYTLKTNAKTYNLIDMHHFSAPSLSPEKDFYTPLIQALEELGLNGNSPEK